MAKPTTIKIKLISTADTGYFYVPDRDARCAGAKLVTQIVWYGSVRTPCTFGFLQEWLANAGFVDIARASFGHSRSAGLAELDNRERESLFVEAAKLHDPCKALHATRPHPRNGEP